MKHIIASLALVALLITGCATNSTVDWRSDIATTANLAAYVGASVDLQDNPERRPAWVAAEVLLGSIIKDDDYTPSQLVAALEGLPVKELRGGKGTLVVGSAVILWTRLAARIDIDRTELVKVVVPAVRAGIQQALAK